MAAPPDKFCKVACKLSAGKLFVGLSFLSCLGMFIVEKP